jgi:hypothetical protein
MTGVFKNTSFLFFCFSIVCFTMPVVGQDVSEKSLVSPELLKAGKLEIVSQNKVPIKEGENLSRLFIVENYLYALSDRNYIVCISRNVNSTIFSRPIAEVGFPVLGLDIYRGMLFSVIGNELIEINQELGTNISSKRLKFNATCPAVRNNLRYYVGSIDRRMHVLRAEDKIPLFEVAPEDKSLITSIVARENLVLFTTDSGIIRCIAPEAPKLLWKFNAAEGIVGPVVDDGRFLFFASRDANIYKLDIFAGRLIWKYPAGAKLDNAPNVTEKIVYQYVRNKGLAAINKENGKLIWRLPEGLDLLAESGQKAYVITNKGTLTVMDNSKAKKLYSINLASADRYATNVLDSKIYIADRSGRIICIKPSE